MNISCSICSPEKYDFKARTDNYRRATGAGDKANVMLNYGYAILRASVARAVVGSGLLPTLGIHHHNRYNAYCLADDIMEPYRPYVDSLVYSIYESVGPEEDLSIDTRTHLLEFLQHDVVFNKTKRPLMLGISQTTASLARCFEGEQKRLQYPGL